MKLTACELWAIQPTTSFLNSLQVRSWTAETASGSSSLWTGKEVKICSGSFPHHLLIKLVYWLQPAEELGWLVTGMVTLQNGG